MESWGEDEFLNREEAIAMGTHAMKEERGTHWEEEEPHRESGHTGKDSGRGMTDNGI